MATAPGKDKATKRAELTRRLMQLAPKSRLDTLLDSTDARGLVRAVNAEDLYMTILDVGISDATEIVQLASPAQFKVFVDLAAWRKDRIDPLEVLTWLRAARGDEPEDFMEKLEAIDLELLELVLRKFVVIHDLEEDPDVNPAGVTMESPEGKYLLEFTVEGVAQHGVRVLLNDIIAKNPFEAGRLFEALRWELPTELEEQAYQFRVARLADLGFPELYEALALFTFIDPAKLEGPRPTPGALVATEGHVDFVEAAFRGLDEKERGQVADEVRYLVNSALVAEGAEPGDPQALRKVSELARDYLTLGLEHLCGGDPGLAADQVRAHPLKRVFQLGFSLTLALKFRLDRLAREPFAKLGTRWAAFDEEVAMLDALALRRPLKALKVEGAEPVAFRSRREIAQTQARLDRVERQREVFVALAGSGPSRFGDEDTAEQRFLAAVAWAVAEGAPKLEPFPSSRLVELGERLFEGEAKAPGLRASAVEKATTAVVGRAGGPLEEEASAMVARALKRLASELGTPYLTEGRLEPTAIVGLPLVDG